MTIWYPARDEYVENICHKGIDFDIDVSTGPIGKGTYFFRHAYDAHERKAARRYKNGERAYMFLCEVLIGDTQKVLLKVISSVFDIINLLSNIIVKKYFCSLKYGNIIKYIMLIIPHYRNFNSP